MSKKTSKTSKPAVLTKGEKILKLLQRNTGATIAELAKVTGWQEHSVQGLHVGYAEEEAGPGDQEQQRR